MLNSFLSVRKDFHRDTGHSSDLDQKRNGVLLMNTIHKEKGTELRKNDDKIGRKRTPSFPSHESTVPVSTEQSQICVKNAKPAM